MRIESLKARIRDLEQQIGGQQIPTTDASGQRCWLPIGEKDLLDIYLALLDIHAAEATGQPINISDEVRRQLGSWSRAELPGGADPLFIEVREEAARLVALTEMGA